MTSLQQPNPAHDHTEPAQRAADFMRRGRWAFWVFAILAAAYLISEHRAHVWGALPLLIILACPLMHMFMHRGHGGHGGHGGKE